VAPRTCDNFEALCMGPLSRLAPDKPHKGKAYSYAGSPFHRVIPNFMVQGGDWTKGDGTGGRSVFKGPKFADEIGGLKLPHAEAGTLSMANAGPNTNSSQFFITLKSTPHLNGRHVVFGKIMDEPSMAVVRDIEAVGSARGSTKVEVTVTGCGLVSRAALADRDLSHRRSAWFRRRIAEMRRMQQDTPEILSSTHQSDMLLLEDLLEQREAKEASDKEERQRKLIEKLSAGSRKRDQQ
jgi:peptidylprolyl isomerase